MTVKRGLSLPGHLVRGDGTQRLSSYGLTPLVPSPNLEGEVKGSRGVPWNPGKEPGFPALS